MSRLQTEVSETVINLDPQHMVRCLQCTGQKIVFDPEMGEKVCQDCGVVLAENIESSDIEINRKFEQDYLGPHIGGGSRLAQADQGLSTVIPYSKIDGNGMRLNQQQRKNMQTIVHWNKISRTNRSYHRNLNEAFACLLRIKDKISLSGPLTEKSAYYYRKTLDLSIIKGRSIKGFITACVYTACREAGVVRSLDEITKAIDTDKVFAGKCYRLLVRRLRIKLPEIDPSSYLAPIANNAGISERSLRKAANMMSTIKNNPVSYGKDPNALAVAVLYAACLANNEKIGQGDLAEAGNMSVITLRKRFLDVRKLFPSVPVSSRP